MNLISLKYRIYFLHVRTYHYKKPNSWAYLSSCTPSSMSARAIPVGGSSGGWGQSDRSRQHKPRDLSQAAESVTDDNPFAVEEHQSVIRRSEDTERSAASSSPPMTPKDSPLRKGAVADATKPSIVGIINRNAFGEMVHVYPSNHQEFIPSMEVNRPALDLRLDVFLRPAKERKSTKSVLKKQKWIYQKQLTHSTLDAIFVWRILTFLKPQGSYYVGLWTKWRWMTSNLLLPKMS